MGAGRAERWEEREEMWRWGLVWRQKGKTTHLLSASWKSGSVLSI